MAVSKLFFTLHDTTEDDTHIEAEGALVTIRQGTNEVTIDFLQFNWLLDCLNQVKKARASSLLS